MMPPKSKPSFTTVCGILGTVTAAILFVLWGLLGAAPWAASHVDGQLASVPRPQTTFKDSPFGAGNEGAADPVPEPELRPEAVIDETVHDFRLMDPGAAGRHEFVIRNEGNAPLELKSGPTTCKCTIAELPQPVVPPGEQAIVRVDWRTVAEPGLFLQSATILTNDPFRPKIRLTVHGTLRAQLAMDPPALEFSKVRPDQPKTLGTLIYSQVWDEFTIESVESSLAGLTWQFEPVPPEAVSDFQGKSGYRFRVTVPADLAPGFFSHWIRLHMRPENGPSEPVVYEAYLTGQVLRRLSVYGRGIDGAGVIYVGQVDQGEGAKYTFLMKVRDPQRNLPVARVVTRPDFLDVRISPHETQKKDLGLYDLEIEIPKDAPRCLYMTSPSGEVRIETSHPRIPELVLPIRFAVVATG